jgi:Cu+-exporting ATPase
MEIRAGHRFGQVSAQEFRIESNQSREDVTMFRRRFLQFLAISGASALAFEAKGTETARTAIYRVKGFSCITCAVGLDTLLSKQKGILASKSTYPEGKVTVKFDPDAIEEKSIEGFIAEMGFSVASRVMV